jgi:hypothetical protein
MDSDRTNYERLELQPVLDHAHAMLSDAQFAARLLGAEKMMRMSQV